MNTAMKDLMNSYRFSLLLSLFGLWLLPDLPAQSFYGKSEVYQVWVDARYGPSEEPEYLYLLGDSSLYLSPATLVNSNFLKEYKIPDVYTLNIRRKGSIGTGILLGAAAGFLANGISDLLRQRHTESACSVCPLLAELELKKGSNRRRYLSTVLLGGVAGGLIGSAKINISIGGSYQKYQFRKEELEKYLLHK